MSKKKEESRIVFLGLPKKQQEELRKKIYKEVAKRTGVKND